MEELTSRIDHSRGWFPASAILVRAVRAVEGCQDGSTRILNALDHAGVHVPEILVGHHAAIQRRLVAYDDRIDASFPEPCEGFECVGVEFKLVPGCYIVRRICVDDTVAVEKEELSRKGIMRIDPAQHGLPSWRRSEREAFTACWQEICRNHVPILMKLYRRRHLEQAPACPVPDLRSPLDMSGRSRKNHRV